MKSRLHLQALESRQVPATLVSPTTLTYQDVDGDFVTVSLNKRVLTADNIASIFTFDGGTFGDNGATQSLKSVDLSSLAVKGANLTITAKNLTTGKASTADVGVINASGIDLNSVLVSGDLGKIQVGDSNLKTNGVNSLTVGSLGKSGPSVGNDLVTEITGSIKNLTIRGDLQDAVVKVEGNLKALSVAGSIKATTTAPSAASVAVKGNIGTVKVSGDLVGGGGEGSGSIITQGVAQEITKTTRVFDPLYNTFTTYTVVVGYRQVGGNIGTVTVGGNISEGAIGSNTGSIQSVKVKGSLIGGEANYSGSIFALSTTETFTSSDVEIPVKLGGNIGSVTIGDSLIGENGTRSGAIIADQGSIGSVKITGDVFGGTGEQSGSIIATGSTKPSTSTRREPGMYGGSYLVRFINGYTLVGGTIGTVTVGGSVSGDSGSQSGSIAALAGSITTVRIGGSLTGGGDYAGSILAQSTTETITVGTGDSTVNVPVKLGGNIGAVTVGSGVIGGFGLRSGSIIASQGNIGSVKITGDLIGGSNEQAGSISAEGSVKPTTKTRRWTVTTQEDGYTHVYHYSETSITGYSLVGGTLGSVSIGGSVLGGTSARSGSIGTEHGSIGAIRIKGNLIGGSGTAAGALYAFGSESLTDTGKKVPLGGSIANILIDGDVIEGSLLADRAIGAITVGKNWNSGNIIVGLNSPITSVSNASLKIGSILIRGVIGGDPPPTTGSYQFTAPTIGSLKVGKQAIKLTKGSANDSKDLTSLVKLVEFDASAPDAI